MHLVGIHRRQGIDRLHENRAVRAGLSKFRPRIPILSFTDMPDVQRKLALSYGVMSYCLKFSADPESTVTEALAQARGSGLLQTGDRVVVVSDAKAHEQLINTVQLRVA